MSKVSKTKFIQVTRVLKHEGRSRVHDNDEEVPHVTLEDDILLHQPDEGTTFTGTHRDRGDPDQCRGSF